MAQIRWQTSARNREIPAAETEPPQVRPTVAQIQWHRTGGETGAERREKGSEQAKRKLQS